MSTVELEMQSVAELSIPSELNKEFDEARTQIENYDYFTAAEQVERLLSDL